MELQVLVHGVDVVEDVSGDSGDYPHHMGVVQVPLKNNIMFTDTNKHDPSFTQQHTHLHGVSLS